MRIALLSCLAFVLSAAGASAQEDKAAAPIRPAAAQDETAPPPAADALVPAAPDEAPAPGPGDAPGPAGLNLSPITPLFGGPDGPAGGTRFWVSAGYLRAWLNNGTNSFPLVTTGPASAPVLGVLGQPGTIPLFSTDNFNTTLNGFQTEVGFWADPDHRLSLSVGGFYLHQPTYTAFATGSDGNGNPVLARPVLNGNTGTEQSYLLSEPNLLAGSTIITAHTELFGIEANAGVNHSFAQNLLGTLLIGYRALHLSDGVTLQDQVQPLAANILTFDGAAVSPPNSIAEQARFQTTNVFNGLQLGGKLHWQHSWFFIDPFAKVALGWTDERVKVDGATALLASGSVAQVAPGEVVTSLTNIGNERRQVFSAVPEFGVNLGVDLLSWLRVKAGYSALGWSNVARAADQIDRVVNPGRIPTDPDFGTISGAARPARIFPDHILWVQSVNVGFEVHY